MQPCKTLFIKHIGDLENVQRNKKKEKGVQDAKLAQARCQSLSIQKIDCLLEKGCMGRILPARCTTRNDKF
jgi:hypothetical protein